MPGDLERWARECPAGAVRAKPPSGEFSFAENVWHLADLEREGYGIRIARLRSEKSPQLPDFEGGRIARERNYNALDLAQGLAAFTAAREENLAALRSLSPSEWERAGDQAGVGQVRLRDVPTMMREHDRSHRKEIEELLSGLRGASDGA